MRSESMARLVPAPSMVMGQTAISTRVVTRGLELVDDTAVLESRRSMIGRHTQVALCCQRLLGGFEECLRLRVRKEQTNLAIAESEFERGHEFRINGLSLWNGNTSCRCFEVIGIGGETAELALSQRVQFRACSLGRTTRGKIILQFRLEGRPSGEKRCVTMLHVTLACHPPAQRFFAQELLRENNFACFRHPSIAVLEEHVELARPIEHLATVPAIKGARLTQQSIETEVSIVISKASGVGRASGWSARCSSGSMQLMKFLLQGYELLLLGLVRLAHLLHCCHLRLQMSLELRHRIRRGFGRGGNV